MNTQMNPIIQISIFASGAGSNALKLLETANTLSRINVACVIIDQETSPLLSILPKKHPSVACIFIPKSKDMSRDQHEMQILSTLRAHQVEWIFLAGYMRILGQTLLAHFPHKIINLHPSLLPAYPGKTAYHDAYQAGVTESGVTVHFVDQGVDTGPIIEQVKFPKLPHDTFESFHNRGREIEWQLYPKTLTRLDQKGNLP